MRRNQNDVSARAAIFGSDLERWMPSIQDRCRSDPRVGPHPRWTQDGALTFVAHTD
jgi:hypothetical protein